MPIFRGPKDLGSLTSVARELIVELRLSRAIGTLTSINVRLGALFRIDQKIDALLKGQREMAGEIEALKGVVNRLQVGVENLAIETGRNTGELRELAAAIGNVTDLQQIGELTTQLTAIADRQEQATAALKAAVDEVDTDGSHAEPAPAGDGTAQS